MLSELVPVLVQASVPGGSYACDLQPAVVDDAEREGEVPIRIYYEVLTSLKLMMNQGKRGLILRGFGSEAPADKSCELGTKCGDV